MMTAWYSRDISKKRRINNNVAGKISDERFAKMKRSYEQEQSGIAGRVKALNAILKKENTRLCTTDAFLEIVWRYTDAKELTGRMVTELIDQIEVYHAERVNGVITQKVVVQYKLHWSFSGSRLGEHPGLRHRNRDAQRSGAPLLGIKKRECSYRILKSYKNTRTGADEGI